MYTPCKIVLYTRRRDNQIETNNKTHACVESSRDKTCVVHDYISYFPLKLKGFFRQAKMMSPPFPHNNLRYKKFLVACTPTYGVLPNLHYIMPCNSNMMLFPL